MNDLGVIRGLLQQALDLIDELDSVKVKPQIAPQPLSQKDYVPAVACVLAHHQGGRGEMFYRDIAKAIQEGGLIELGPQDLEEIKLNDRERVPRIIQRVRDAIVDTALGKQFFERGSKRGYYRLSEIGLQFYSKA